MAHVIEFLYDVRSRNFGRLIPPPPQHIPAVLRTPEASSFKLLHFSAQGLFLVPEEELHCAEQANNAEEFTSPGVNFHQWELVENISASLLLGRTTEMF